MQERSIIHINVADFAVAVERSIDSRLRHRPVIVAPAAAARASVYDMSEEAYRSGVRKEMPLARAQRRCPDAAVLAPHPDRYEHATAVMLRHAMRYSPRIEITDCKGHLYIDATGSNRLFGPPQDVAERIRRAVRNELGVAPIWTVAVNKLVAKTASRIVKPDGEYLVRPGEESAFLAPLPLHLIPGIDPQTLFRLREFNLDRAGQVAGLTTEQLAAVLGRRALALFEAVRGIDRSPVLPAGGSSQPVRVEHVLAEDSNEVEVVEGALFRLVEQAGARLRRHRRAARKVGLILDHSDGGRVARQAALRPPAADDIGLFAAARTVLQRVWFRRVRIRRLELTCGRLTEPPAQRALFAAEEARRRDRENLMNAIDTVRRRFGDNAIRVGRTMAA